MYVHPHSRTSQAGLLVSAVASASSNAPGLIDSVTSLLVALTTLVGAVATLIQAIRARRRERSDKASPADNEPTEEPSE